MEMIIVLLFVLLFWFLLLRRSYKKIGKGQSKRTKLEPNYNMDDPCPKRRGEAALCGYCPLFDSNTGECSRGRWRGE